MDHCLPLAKRTVRAQY